MQTFPRLTAVFGVPVDSLTATEIDTAVAQRVPEGEDLDWKKECYPTTNAGREELAKDVGALANAGGGILVIGVTEDSASGCAAAPNPVPLSGSEADRMQQICHFRLRPFLPGVRINRITTGPGVGYYVIIVPRSPDAPHAVATSDNGHVVFYPLRDGATTRFLGEAEIAARYRDRFATREQLGKALDRVHSEGISRIATWKGPWVAVSLYPTVVSERRRSGTEALAAATGFFVTWTRYTAPPLAGFPNVVQEYAGVRRAMITGELDLQGVSTSPHAELHYNGAGFAALPVQFSDNQRESREQVPPGTQRVEQDYLELQLIALISLLAHHAANSGSGGDCELRAQLLLTTITDKPSRSVRPVVVDTPAASIRGRRHGVAIDIHQRADRTLVVDAQQDPTAVTASLDELVSDTRAIVRAAYACAADILGAFGIADPCVLRSDGVVAVEHLHDDYRRYFMSWAERNHLTDNP
ncbi:AlbA family DNA-binding domain-containing protein [Nocardia tengchongensis]|uniref:AlbA family DNA-binding domain-containing protein n=1 Tax=Nocardia tengchongensis TaxID=2055889 RepID=UPI003699EA08